ncbi:MAG: tetratricopeptide repeat protein [Ramlibacter sp.]|nr:tetratricopeptide repeat protein [Ramlibacter sp.]
MGQILIGVDTWRYFFDLLTGNALVANRQYEEAATFIHRSLRVNKRHVPTLRLLATAQGELGQFEEGKKTLGRLVTEAPGFTVSSYLAMGGPDSSMRQRCATVMRQLGLPEN